MTARSSANATRVVASEDYKAIDPDTVDPWWVGNKDPNFEYMWARTDKPMDLIRFRQMGYVPATGNEQIVGVPYGEEQPGEGKEKRIGVRILMMCPKDRVQNREERRQQRDRALARRDAQNRAQEIQTEMRREGHKGLTVKAITD